MLRLHDRYPDHRISLLFLSLGIGRLKDPMHCFHTLIGAMDGFERDFSSCVPSAAACLHLRLSDCILSSSAPDRVRSEWNGLQVSDFFSLAAGSWLLQWKDCTKLHHRPLCVNWLINTRDLIPLPRIDDALHAVGSSKVFSTLDLTSSYCQIELDPESRLRTAFCLQKSALRICSHAVWALQCTSLNATSGGFCTCWTQMADLPRLPRRHHLLIPDL